MHVVAVYNMTGPAEELVPRLAEALGILPYEARSRVVVPGGGPAVVGCFAEATSAAACAERLQACGFSVLQVDAAELGAAVKPFIARTVHFTDSGLEAVGRDEALLALPWEQVRLLLRVTGFSTHVESETRKEKKFSPGLAVASGGLMMRKTVKSTTETTVQVRQPFCYVYAPPSPPLLLRQEEMDYASLGPDIQYSREANFNWICTELRRRCPDSVWDDRLGARPGQAQLLGPLSPDNYLGVAIELLARANGVFPR